MILNHDNINDRHICFFVSEPNVQNTNPYSYHEKSLETNLHILIAYSHMFVQNFQRGHILIRQNMAFNLDGEKGVKFP